MKTIFFSLALALLFTACDETTDLFDNDALTQSEVVEGLKEALKVGTDSAAAKLGVTDGYYADQLVKIGLPPEALVITDYLTRIPGMDQLVEDVVLRVNRAAEDAVKEAGPIFWNSITSMSFTDAWGIFQGADTAATHYFKTTTNQQLFNLYQPKIKTSLDKKIIGGISTNESWKTLTDQWNSFASSPFNILLNLQPIETDLDTYLTNKALEGLFLKIAGEEQKIRKDPVARVTDILQRVFGNQDN